MIINAHVDVFGLIRWSGTAIFRRVTRCWKLQEHKLMSPGLGCCAGCSVNVLCMRASERGTYEIDANKVQMFAKYKIIPEFKRSSFTSRPFNDRNGISVSEHRWLNSLQRSQLST